MIYLVCILLFVFSVNAENNKELEGLSHLPQHFHLDDYHRCLSRRDGLYCYGTFELTPTKHPHPTYEYIKEYSSNTAYHYNRTLIHRGYCVSARCASYTGNVSSRFERCLAEWAQPRSLQAKLCSLHYCRTHADVTAAKLKPLDVPQLVFLCTVVAILILNAVATIYDSCYEDSSNNLLRLWSIRANWHRLVNVHQGGEARLNNLLPAHGLKAITVFLGVVAHCNGANVLLLSQSSHKVEQLLMTSYASFTTNGTAITSGLLSLSAFLTSYNLLLASEKIPLNLKLLPLCILKRMIRFTPVYLLIVGYAATWWVRTGDGPIWSPTVGYESQICRQKFWAHLLYANNLIDPGLMCVGPTWSVAVDMQLGVIVSCVTLYLARLRGRALPILAVMIIVSCVVNTVLGYVYQWVPLREFVNPETIREKLNIPSFNNFYIQWWGSLPSSLIGVFAAHSYYELQSEELTTSKRKWLKIAANWTIPVLIGVTILIGFVNPGLSRTASALFIGFERPIVSSAMILAFYANITVKGWTHDLLSWRGFQFLSRLSLPLAISSWVTHLTFAASRSHPSISLNSFLDMYVDGLATYSLTVFVSVPMAILLEIPTRRFLDGLLFSFYKNSMAKDKKHA